MAESGATVAGLLSLTVTAVGISHRYLSTAKNATKQVQGYFRELEALKVLLGDFKTLDPKSNSAATTTALEGCHSELERLRSKLQKWNTDTTFSAAIHRLTWPFAEEETRHLIEVIHRYFGHLPCRIVCRQGASRQLSLDRKPLFELLKVVLATFESVTVVLDALD